MENLSARRQGPLASHAAEHGPAIRREHVLCLTSGQLHRMSYVEWGAPDNPRVVLCVHGLTRNARDFDALAQALSDRFRVICPDVAGRGRSDWLAHKPDYNNGIYAQHMITLLARCAVEQVDWIGVSMGGLIGLLLAAMPEGPIRRLVLSDIGGALSYAGLQRIYGYVGLAPHFADFAEALGYFRQTFDGFGPLTDAQWRHLTAHSVRPDATGYAVGYDPAIGETLRATALVGDVPLWPLYDALKCPTFVLRGAESDLLSAQVAAVMPGRGPCAQVVDIPGVGHAPMLQDAAQIALVNAFLAD